MILKNQAGSGSRSKIFNFENRTQDPKKKLTGSATLNTTQSLNLWDWLEDELGRYCEEAYDIFVCRDW